MSTPSIALYLDLGRMKITGQSFSAEGGRSWIGVEPPRGSRPICHRCGTRCRRVHSRTRRRVRDLAMGSTRVWLDCHLRKTPCPRCERIVVERNEAAVPWQRVTPRFAHYVHGLCKMLSVADAARHLTLDWKTVKEIDKRHLEATHGGTDLEGLRVLAVDEIAVKKGHRYMTVVLDYESGRVVWMGEGRRQATLESFFDLMSEQQRERIEAIAMDMWDPYIAAARKKIPQAAIVFDLFHVVSAFGKVIDRVRIDETQAAEAADREIYKGSKYLLLKNAENLKEDQHDHLQQLLALNERLCMVYILRDELKRLWNYRRRPWAARALAHWCALARSVGHHALDKFANTLERYCEGILNHCQWPIHTSRLEGVNNKIKVIKRKAFGFHDPHYFMLKVKQAFP